MNSSKEDSASFVGTVPGHTPMLSKTVPSRTTADACDEFAFSGEKGEPLTNKTIPLGKSADTKPPLGLMPEELYEAKCAGLRIREIIDAMIRFNDDNRRIPDAWFDELRQRTGS